MSIINSTWARLDLEINTRQLTGAQAVADTNVYVVKDLKLSDLEDLNDRFLKRLEEYFKSLLNRECFSIFNELGVVSHQPIRSQKPNPLPDRKALDDGVFDILGLTQDERKEVYWSVCELLKTGLKRQGVCRCANP